jgi:putative phage-type endonuclease
VKGGTMKQGTPEWHEARRAKITGTGFSKVLSKKDGKTRTAYMRQLILERKTGVTADGYYDKNMEVGNQTEPQARLYYEKINKVKIEQAGFVDYHPESKVELAEYGNYVGVSPDGLVGTDGGVEIKCPLPKTHLEYMTKNRLPSTYKPQVQGILWVTNRKWCDFISFCPQVEKQPYWCIRIERDEEYIKNLKTEVSKFIDEMLKMQIEIQDVDPQLLIDVTGGSNEDDWLLAKQMEIRGKVRHGVVCALIQAGKQVRKKRVKELVDFIITGE